MENENPDDSYLMSNFNSNISASAKVSDTPLLSSAGTIYNVTDQSQITQDCPQSATSNHGHLFEYPEETVSAEQYMSNENRVMSISPN